MRAAFADAGLVVSHMDCPPFPRGLYLARRLAAA
jgi:hypothetical protein